MSRLRFGIIGMSPGNGHPYSWSAIFNGYDPTHMARCPFPAIPAYLAQQQFPEAAISAAEVTQVWTQDRAVSKHIAAAARIPKVVDDFRAMVGTVDGVLLARDDAENHLRFAGPFLDAGLPIYIDKPLATSVAAATRLFARQKRAGQIFTGSALGFASEFRPSPDTMVQLGRLAYVEAITLKDWDHYAVHVIEPLTTLLAHEGPVVEMRAHGWRPRHLDMVWQSGLSGRVTALGTADGPMAIRVYGDQGCHEMVFRETFKAFRAALTQFTDIVAGRAPPQDPNKVLEIIRLIEAGQNIATRPQG